MENLQLISRVERKGGRVVAATLVGAKLFLCDSTGNLEVWSTQPCCCELAARCSPPPFALIPFDNDVFAIFSTHVSRYDDLLSEHRLLEVDRVSAACIGDNKELYLANRSRIRSHPVRPRTLPLRLQIVFAEKQIVRLVRECHGTLFAITESFVLYAWNALSGALLSSRRLRRGDHSFDHQPIAFSGSQQIVAQLQDTLRVWHVNNDDVVDLPCSPNSCVWFDEQCLGVLDNDGTLRTYENDEDKRECVAASLAHLAGSDMVLTSRDEGMFKLVACSERGVAIVAIHHRTKSPRTIARGSYFVCDKFIAVGASSCCSLLANDNSFRILRHRTFEDEATASSASSRALVVGFQGGCVAVLNSSSLDTQIRWYQHSTARVTTICYDDHSMIAWAGFADGTVAGLSQTKTYRLPPHGARLVFAQKLISSLPSTSATVATFSADGELRVWRVSLEDDEPLQLKLHAELGRRTSAFVLPPLKRQTMAVGSADGRLEIWVLERKTALLSASSSKQHAHSIECISATPAWQTAAIKQQYLALLTSSKDCVVRWILGEDGDARSVLRPAERFCLAKPPVSVSFLPLGDLDWCVAAVCAQSIVSLASCSEHNLFYQFGELQTTPISASYDVVANVAGIPVEGVLQNSGEKSRAVVVGGRIVSAPQPTAKRDNETIEKRPKRQWSAKTKQPLPLKPTVIASSPNDGEKGRSRFRLAKKPRSATVPFPTEDDFRRRVARDKPRSERAHRERFEGPETVVCDVTDSYPRFATNGDSYELVRKVSSKEFSPEVVHEKTRRSRRERFYSDRRTLQLSSSAPGIGLCTVRPRTTLNRYCFEDESRRCRAKTTKGFREFVPSQVFAIPFWDGGISTEYDEPPISSYGLATRRRHRDATGDRENSEEFEALMRELRMLKEQEAKALKPIRGIRGYGYGTALPGEEDEDSRAARRRRIRQLETVIIQEQQACSPEQDDDDEESYLEWVKRMRDAFETDQSSLANDSETSSNLLLETLQNSGEVGLYGVFRQLLPTRLNSEWLLPFARLKLWAPCAYAIETLGLRKEDLRAMWRQAHRNIHGADRGDFDDFVDFAIDLEQFIEANDLGPCLRTIRVLRCSSKSVQVCAEFEQSRRGIENELALARIADGRDPRRRVELKLIATRSPQQVPSYKDFRDAPGSVVCEDEAVVRGIVRSLEPDCDYYVFAFVAGWTIKVRELGMRDSAVTNERIAKSRLDVKTNRDESIQIQWSSMTEDQQRTELLATLKSKDACAAARALGIDIPKPSDAKKSVQANDPAAAARWEAWAAWWPNSGAVRIDFMRNEMLFAAKQSQELRDMAEAEGAPIEIADIMLAKEGKIDDDPVRKRRWDNFQRWYCGMPIVNDEDDDVDEEIQTTTVSRTPLEGQSNRRHRREQRESRRSIVRSRGSSRQRIEKSESPFSIPHSGLNSDGERIMNNNNSRESRDMDIEFSKDNSNRILSSTDSLGLPAGKSSGLLNKTSDGLLNESRCELPLDGNNVLRAEPNNLLPNDQEDKLPHNNEDYQRKEAFTTAAKENAVISDAESDTRHAVPSTIAMRQQGNARFAARLASRNQFLNNRTSKVSDMRARLEKTKEKQLKTKKRKPLKAYVKMIMFQIRMQKTLGAGGATADLDTEIDIFAEVDEAVFEAALEKMSETVRNDEEISPSAEKDEEEAEEIPPLPEWTTMSTQARNHEMELACVDPEMLEMAIECCAHLPDPEDFSCQDRVEDFANWYPNDPLARAKRFLDEVSAAMKDPRVRQDAVDAGIEESSFKTWYAGAFATRASYLARQAERLLEIRRAFAASSQLASVPQIALLRVPPPACLPRDIVGRQRYLLYPSRTPETWSAREIMAWDDDCDDLDAMRDALRGPLEKWHVDQWLRDEHERQRHTRNQMVCEDERSSRLRNDQQNMLSAEDATVAHFIANEASKAGTVIRQVRDGRIDSATEDSDLILSSLLSSWNLADSVEGARYFDGTGLLVRDDEDCASSRKRLAAEELALEHELKMQRREAERKQREELERKQREEFERKRLIELQARDRQRVRNEFDEIRARRAVKAALRQRERDESQRMLSLAIDRDRALAVVSVAMAREAARLGIVASTTLDQDPAVDDHEGEVDGVSYWFDGDKNYEEESDDHSVASLATSDEEILPPYFENDYAYYRALGHVNPEECERSDALFGTDLFLNDIELRSLRKRTTNPYVLPHAESMAKTRLSQADFVLTEQNFDTAQVVEALRAQRTFNAARRLGLSSILPSSKKSPELFHDRLGSFPMIPQVPPHTMPPPKNNTSVSSHTSTGPRFCLPSVSSKTSSYMAKMPYYRSRHQTINVKGARVELAT